MHTLHCWLALLSTCRSCEHVFLKDSGACLRDRQQTACTWWQSQHGQLCVGSGQPVLARAHMLPPHTLFQHAAFVPPGYASLFFAHLYENASCPYPTDLFASFRQWVWGRLGLDEDDASSHGPVKVRSVSCSCAAFALQNHQNC